MSTISVVVPMFNEEGKIAECLEAILAQTRPVDEIIVVDNMSTDNSVERVREIAAAHPVIAVISEREPGCYAARSAGYDAASGDVIARTDADTRVAPDWAQRIDDFFDSDEGADYAAITGVTTLYDAPPFDVVNRMSRKSPRGLENGGETGSITGHNHAMRKSAWIEIRDSTTRRQDVWEDLDMGLTLAERQLKMYFDPNLLVESSIRALRKSPIASRRYITGIVRTAKARDNKAAIRIAYQDVPVRFAMFTGMWLMFRPWDQASQTWRLRRLFQKLDDEHLDVTEVR